jgi:type VI secretion system protein ImpH
MAGTDRKTADDLAALLKTLEQSPFKYGFYQILRLMESLYKERPRLGTSKRPDDDPIRLSQEAALTFETSGLTAFKPGTDHKPHQLKVRLLGLLGPNGPMPLHFTEYVMARRRDHKDHTFASFLDIFHHRMLSLFYRAWANNEPTVSYDRPDDDRFSAYIGSLLGLGSASTSKPNDIADQTKLYYCGWLSSRTKCAEGLKAVLTDYFHIPAGIEEFIGEWIHLPQQYICRLGRDRTNGTLGRSAIAGTKVWSCQHKFRIHIGPLSYHEYERFLPTGDRITRLVQLVRNYVGDELAFDVRLILKKEDVPSAQMDGGCRLGWTSWSGERSGESDADDLILDAYEWVIGSQDS